MKIMVAVKLVPDLVENLEIAPGGTGLDRTYLRLILSEPDEHALEQALLLKDESTDITVVAPGFEEADDVLFTAAAKGADRLVKLTDGFQEGCNCHALARALRGITSEIQPDLILTGVQAHDDLDGSLGPLLAGLLNLPYVGNVAGLSITEGKATARKEYSGGLIGEMEIGLPAVIGIVAAEAPPRYVAVSKVRQMVKSATLEPYPVGDLDPGGGIELDRMYKPESVERATMIEGTAEEIAVRLIEVLKELDVL